MDIVGLVTQLALLVACLVAALALFIVVLMLGMAYAGDGSDRSAASAKEQWEDRLIAVGAILAVIIKVGLLIAAFGILWNIVGLGQAVVVAAVCVVVFLRLAK